MKAVRVIPRLDIKGPNLVKGINLEGLRVLGKPEDFSFQYYLDGADELIYMDVVASLYGRNNLLDVVRRTAENAFIPLTVGGGIRSIEDMRQALRAGADKVAINTAAIKTPELINEGARTFGSQCVVISIEAKKMGPGCYEAYTDNGRERTGVDVFEWVQEVCRRGAGELIVTSVDNEGTGKGFDVELIKRIVNSVPIPVIACGGAGSLEHFSAVIREAGADAIGAASVFHYNRINAIATESNFSGEGNVEFLKSAAPAPAARITPLSITDVKGFLDDNDIACRPVLAGSSQKDTVACRHSEQPRVTIIDYGLGNLFSVARALSGVGASVEISDDPDKILSAERLILPGVGSFGDGMSGLRRRGLIKAIKEYAESGRPLLGICLGMQLLMSEGQEFGKHEGLDIVKGFSSRLNVSDEYSKICKIPHIGWNKILRSHGGVSDGDHWKDTILENLGGGAFMYFVHSNVVSPLERGSCLAETEYGAAVFCSVLRHKNIYGCQFHPERSGNEGLRIYSTFIYGKESVIKI